MKFKKTKLTALAMSVLMAASTITSVTWAADLFTDGSVEEATEAPGVFSDTETEEVISDNILLSAPNYKEADAAGYTDAELASYPVVGVIYPTGEYNAVYVDGSDYRVYFRPLHDIGGTLPVAEREAISLKVEPIGESLPATCEHAELLKFPFSYGGVPFTAYGVKPNGNPQTEHVAKTVPIKGYEGTDATCTTDGSTMGYTECRYCGMIYANDGNGGFKYIKFSEVKKADATLANLSSKDEIDSDYYSENSGTKGVDTIAFTQVVIGAKGHQWGDWYKTVLPKSEDLNMKTIPGYTLPKPITDYEQLANCTIDESGHHGRLEDDRDAYYYYRRYCPVCKQFGCAPQDPDEGKVTFYYGGMVENTSFYEAGSHVVGFVYVNSEGFLDVWPGVKDSKGKLDTKKIPVDKFVDAILDDCKNTGTYYLNAYNGKDYEIHKETYTKKGHTYGNVEVKPNSTGLEVDDKGKYVVDYDENKDVIAAYSDDCTKKDVVYQLVRICMNSSCGHVENYGAPQKTEKGAHLWGTWVPSDKTTYTQVNETQHKEHYFEKRTCQRCKEVEERDSTTKADALVNHAYTMREIKDTRVDATCGTDGSYKRGDTCACGYIKEDSITTVTIPCTDKHDFGTNPAFIEWSGEIKINGLSLDGKETANRNLVASIVRKCNVCGKTDSNGINDIKVTAGGIGYNNNEKVVVKVDPKSIVDAKKDPATGVTYACSTAHATVYVDWVGTVDDKLVRLNSTTATNAVKENVPYYSDINEYQARTAHTPGAVKIENRVEPTTEEDGSYDEVVYCTVCGDEVSRNTVTIPKDIQVSVPTVTATAVNYNTVNVSWTPVEGATSYRLYYRSADLGITTWHRVRTLKGTSFTHSGLTTGARYRYTVRAEVNGKLGDYSKTGSVARPLPAAPEMKSVTAVSNGTKVTWSKVDGADGYIIFRKTTGAFTRVGSVSKGSKVTWTDKKPVSGATYKVRAYRTVNNVNYKGAFSAAK